MRLVGLLLRLSVGSLSDHAEFHIALVPGIVVTTVAGSLTLAMQLGLDPVLRTFSPDPGAEFESRPVTPTHPIAPTKPAMASAPVAVEQLPAAVSPERPAARFAATPVPASVAAVPTLTARSSRPRVVALPPPRPRPTQTAKRASDEPQSANRQRQSRSQVERNVLNEKRMHAAVDAAADSQPYGGDASALIVEARRYVGTNPTRRARLWCARFMNFVLQRAGYRGTGSDMALSFAKYGNRVPGPRVGAIAVLRRKGGGHVGIVTAVPGKGRIRLISGNDGHRVRERVRSTRAVIAYVMPRR